MARWYQPAVIRTLADAGGTATMRSIAIGLLSQDERYVADSEAVVKRWPRQTLVKRGVVEVDGDVVRLCVKRLSLAQRAELRAACDVRLQRYWQEHGLPSPGVVPASLRYRLIREAGGRCVACHHKDRPLDIDHIIPSAEGGTSEEANLQVLCYECNRAKRNADDMAFDDMRLNTKDDCPFCAAAAVARPRDTEGWMVAVEDHYPVSEHHHLVVPMRHLSNYFRLNEDEHRDAAVLLKRLSQRLKRRDASIAGFNVGVNVGEAAGQTIEHVHIHLIPRRKGDVEDPRGGVRGVIPGAKLYEGMPRSGDDASQG